MTRASRTTRAPGTRPRAEQFLALHRGGGLFTETINQRIAAYLCVLANRWHLAPTVLTLANLALGLGASISMIAMAPRVATDPATAVAVGFAALAAWQLAYSLDCADGQLARFTGLASPAGKRVDLLSDVALQISVVAAVATVAEATAPATPTWLLAAFAGTWMVNLVTSALQQSTAAASLVASSAPGVRVLKLVRDYGAVITVVGLTLALRPHWAAPLMIAFTAGNGGFLIASIASAARGSLRRS